MTKDKAEHHVMLASTTLLVIFALFALFVASIVQASPGPDSAASNATFRTKCAMCHGQEGGGSEVGDFTDDTTREWNHNRVLAVASD
jgi:cytochrome c